MLRTDRPFDRTNTQSVGSPLPELSKFGLSYQKDIEVMENENINSPGDREETECHAC
jgi:hypothetical protein